jgi:hypothetical protein
MNVKCVGSAGFSVVGVWCGMLPLLKKPAQSWHVSRKRLNKIQHAVNGNICTIKGCNAEVTEGKTCSLHRKLTLLRKKISIARKVNKTGKVVQKLETMRNKLRQTIKKLNELRKKRESKKPKKIKKPKLQQAEQKETKSQKVDTSQPTEWGDSIFQAESYGTCLEFAIGFYPNHQFKVEYGAGKKKKHFGVLRCIAPECKTQRSIRQEMNTFKVYQLGDHLVEEEEHKVYRRARYYWTERQIEILNNEIKLHPSSTPKLLHRSLRKAGALRGASIKQVQNWLREKRRADPVNVKEDITIQTIHELVEESQLRSMTVDHSYFLLKLMF